MSSPQSATERPFSDRVMRTWEENVLFSALVELTYRCNLDCFFCYNDVALRGEPLSKKQYVRFFEDLAEMQVLFLVLTGGEPLAHPDFLELGARARRLGFSLRIKSNGHALHGSLARRVKDEIDPYAIDISLHGARAETHDRQTRVPGSFERLIRNLPELLELGLRVKLNATLTAWNEHEIDEMLDLARGLGLVLQIDPEVTPRDNGDLEPLTIRPSDRALSDLMHRRLEALTEHRTELRVTREGDELAPAAPRSKHCGAGSSTIAVDPFGSVYPCVQWRRPIGNLHRSSIREIWSESSELETLRRQNTEVKQMIDGLGAAAPLAGFCPGSARLEEGSHTVLNETSRIRLEAGRRAATGHPSGPLPVLQ